MSGLKVKPKIINKCIIVNIAPVYLSSKESSVILIKELEESLDKQSRMGRFIV